VGGTQAPACPGRAHPERCRSDAERLRGIRAGQVEPGRQEDGLAIEGRELEQGGPQRAVLDPLGRIGAGRARLEVEQRVEQGHGISVTLANDKAMSQRNSPFRTVGVLADHVVATAQETSS